MYCSQDFEGGREFTDEMSAIDVALLDIAGKALHVPVYQLLGGKQREPVPCFVSTDGSSKEALIESSDGCGPRQLLAGTAGRAGPGSWCSGRWLWGYAPVSAPLSWPVDQQDEAVYGTVATVPVSGCDGNELYVPSSLASIRTSAICRPLLCVPHHAEIRLLSGKVRKLRLFEFEAVAMTAFSNEK